MRVPSIFLSNSSSINYLSNRILTTSSQSHMGALSLCHSTVLTTITQATQFCPLLSRCPPQFWHHATLLPPSPNLPSIHLIQTQQRGLRNLWSNYASWQSNTRPRPDWLSLWTSALKHQAERRTATPPHHSQHLHPARTQSFWTNPPLCTLSFTHGWWEVRHARHKMVRKI